MYRHNAKTFATIASLRQCKLELFDDIQGTVDYALPQGWLNDFADWCKSKRPDVTYEMIRSTTCWWYCGQFRGPVTCCDEVAEAYAIMTHRIV